MNEYLAVLGGGPCWAVHPSDPAVALLALDASVTVRRSDGTAEQRPLRELYVLPSVAVERETTLAVNEVVELIVLPPQYAGTRQSFRKVMQRQAWDFALASVAVVWPAHSARPRIVLGGVAPVPWLVEPEILPAAPARVRTRAFELWAANVADLALAGAKPLARNAYKVELTKALVRRALGARYSPASSATRASR
jgi:xanthine dehydrogenase YagS FAD-binding subunit